MLLSAVPFEPELFVAYQQETVADKSRLVTSGIMQTNAEIQGEFAKGGRTVDLPFFGDLSGDSQILSDVSGLTADTLGGGVQRGVRHMRGKGWKSSDLAAELAGSDPMQAIARRTGAYWTREMQKFLVNSLKGLYASGGPLNTSHVAGSTATALSQSAIIDGFAQLGDSGEELSMIIMSSEPFYALAKMDLIIPGGSTSQIDSRVSAQRPEFGTFMGRPVLVDDGMPVDAGAGTGGGSGKDVHKIYLFAPGAFLYAMAPARVPVETDRVADKGIDILYNRLHMLVHPNGIDWTGTPAGNSPSYAELATGTNWTKAFTEDKNIKMIQLSAYIA